MRAVLFELEQRVNAALSVSLSSRTCCYLGTRYLHNTKFTPLLRTRFSRVVDLVPRVALAHPDEERGARHQLRYQHSAQPLKLWRNGRIARPRAAHSRDDEVSDPAQDGRHTAPTQRRVAAWSVMERRETVNGLHAEEI